MSSVDLNAPEVQDAIKAAVKEATEALSAKRNELLAELKKARKNSEIDPDDFQKLKEENEALSDKLSELSKQAKTAMSEAEKHKKALEAENGFVSKLLVDNGLTEAVLKAGVKPEFTKAVKSMLASQVQLKADGENRIPVIGDKPLSEFIESWSKSDEGKHFVSAPNNSGGGAQGGGGASGTSKQMSRSQFEAITPNDKMAFVKSGGKLTE